MDNIQHISEKLLLMLYTTYRRTGIITNEVISFENDESWQVNSGDSEVIAAMMDLSDNSVLNLRAAIKYLNEKKLISFSMNGLLSSEFEIYDLGVTSRGIDIIEGITGSQTSKTIYQNTFNVRLADTINLESLIATKLGAEFKLF